MARWIEPTPTDKLSFMKHMNRYSHLTIGSIRVYKRKGSVYVIWTDRKRYQFTTVNETWNKLVELLNESI